METHGYITKSRDGAYYTATVVRRLGKVKSAISVGSLPNKDAAQRQLADMKSIIGRSNQELARALHPTWYRRIARALGFGVQK